MNAVSWYIARARAMSAPEVIHRLREQFLTRYSRVNPPSIPSKLTWSPHVHTFGNLIVELWGANPEISRHWQLESEATISDGPLIFGERWPVAFGVPEWHKAFPSNGSWPTDYCFDINFRHSKDEVRLTWELNRLLWLIPLAATSTLEDDGDRANQCSALLQDWMESNQPQFGVNWATGIECAMQIIALTTLEDLLSRVLPDAHRSDSVARCIAHRAAWIKRFPSRFSSANNHSIAEYAGRFVTSVVLNEMGDPDESTRLFHLLQDEYTAQHTRDGTNREQAPHYGLFVHEIAALCTLLAASAEIKASETWIESLARAATSITELTDSGGHLLCFGDNDGSGVLSACLPHDLQVSCVLDLLDMNRDLALTPRGVTSIGENWYSVCRSLDSWGETMWVMDHAPLGFGALAAHGHADTLSVWLSINGRPVFIEAGTYLYHSDERWRSVFRSTLLHNTVSVEGADSSVMSGAFNWSPRLRASAEVRSIKSGEHWSILAAHDGYKSRLDAVHVRQLSRVDDARFEIVDQLESTRLRSVTSSFLIAPDIEISPLGSGWHLLRDGSPLVDIQVSGFSQLSTELANEVTGLGWHSDQFMKRSPATQLLINGQLGMGRSLHVEISNPTESEL